MASRVGLCGFLTVHNYNVGNELAQESAIVTFKRRDENAIPYARGSGTQPKNARNYLPSRINAKVREIRIPVD